MTHTTSASRMCLTIIALLSATSSVWTRRLLLLLNQMASSVLRRRFVLSGASVCELGLSGSGRGFRVVEGIEVKTRERPGGIVKFSYHTPVITVSCVPRPMIQNMIHVLQSISVMALSKFFRQVDCLRTSKADVAVGA